MSSRSIRPATATIPDHGAESIFDTFGYAVSPLLSEKVRAPMAEFFGMILFVWIGCGTAVSTQSILALDANSHQENTFHISVSLAFGLAISVLVYTIAPISGGHFNPAVTLAFMVGGNMDFVVGLSYMLAQFFGSLLGAALVYATFASKQIEEVSGGGDLVPPFLVGSNFVNPTVPIMSAFLGEALGTLILVWTVIMTAVDPKSIAGNLAPIAIGLSVTLANFVLVPITGCGINPARTFGPHMVIILAGQNAAKPGWWVYYTAPFVGSFVAVAVTRLIFHVRFQRSQSSENVAPRSETAGLIGTKEEGRYGAMD